MDEKLVRRIQEEHKANGDNALRNAKLLAISSINGKYRITVEDILKEYTLGNLDDAKTIEAIIHTLGAAKNDLHDAFELIELLFGKPEKGSMSDLDKQLEEEFDTCNWVDINEMLYDPGSVEADDPLSGFDMSISEPGKTKKETKTISKIRKPKREYNEAGVQRIMKEFDSYIGWESVKEQIKRLINLTKYNLDRKNRGKSYSQVTNHMIFTGNPGTGKTTVAKLVGKIYKEMGLLSKGGFMQVSRADLIGEHIGHTESKTEAIIMKAMGGVLFIDEAYSLAPKDPQTDRDFGKRAIEVLIQAMENYRDDLIVIAAGYTDNMQEFLDSNPGLTSRFSNTIHFEDYNEEALFQICLLMISNQGLMITEEAKVFLKTVTEAIYKTRDKNFGNARDMRNLVDKLVLLHADRVATNMDELTEDDKDTITLDDCQRLKKFAEYTAIIPE